MISRFLSFLLCSILVYGGYGWTQNVPSRICLKPVLLRHQQTQRVSAVESSSGIPPGRVQDIDQWVQWSSDSLKKLTGKSLFDEMENVRIIQDIHDTVRYAVLSHGMQDDPIYNYFNQGALQTFLFPEDEVYQTPSRKSAPEGAIREEREHLMQTVATITVRRVEKVIRNTKFGKRFEIYDLILWNVYDDNGIQIGQTALFDRSKIVPIDEFEPLGTYEQRPIV